MQVMEYYEQKEYVLVGPEETVYISARGGYGELGSKSGFEAAMTINTNLGLGFVTEYPIVVENGGTYMISNGTTHTVDMPLERYFYYIPQESGMMTFGTTSYLNLRYAIKNSTEFQPVTCQYSIDDHLNHYDIPVNEGEPLLIQAEIQAGNTCLVKVSQLMQHGGDGLKPATSFVLGETNTVPTHFGSYWYRYDAKETGFVVLSSQASMPGGRVNFYGSSTGFKEYSSKQGTFDLRFAVTKGMSYYLTIDKIETTADETPFQVTFSLPQPGDSYNDPIILDLDANPSVVITTPGYTHQNYNYAIDMKGPDDVFELRVHCLNPASEVATFSLLTFYPFGNMYYGSGLLYGGEAMTAGNTLVTDWSLAQGNGSTVPAGRYFIYIEKGENVPLSFLVEKVSVEPGDVLENPIVLSETGLQEIPAKDVVYYGYTAPQNGVLTLTLDDPELSATFYQDGNQIRTEQQGLTYRLKVKQDQAYAFRIDGAGEGLYTFTLELRDFEPGESPDMPLRVTGDIVLGSQEADTWYDYVVERDGILSLGANLTDKNVSVGYILNYVPGTLHPIETSIISALSDTDELLFGTELPIHLGDVVTIHIKTTLPQPGLGVQISVRDYRQGETLTDPYVLTPDQPLKEFRTASRYLPTFIRIPVSQGRLRIYSDMAVIGTLYADATLSKEVALFTTSSYVIEGAYLRYVLDTYVAEPEADYYLVLSQGGGRYSALSIREMGGQGIEQIRRDEDEVTGFDLMGRRSDSHGLVIEQGTVRFVR